MIPNPLILLVAALIPMVIGIIWYGKGLFGGATWARIANLPAEAANMKPKPGKMLLSILFNFFIAFALFGMCVHQSGVFSVVGGNAELLKTGVGAEFMAAYGHNHLSIGHGIFHGVLASITFAMPMIGYATIFEQKGAKYFFVNWGFWAVCLAIMGAIICQGGGMAA